MIRHTRDELTITSPGGFIAGISPQNILRHEPISRNRTLAELFQKLGLVERAGVGRKRIFHTLLGLGKRMPVYQSDDQSVTLRIYDKSYDKEMAAMFAKWRDEGREIELDTLLVISFLRENSFLDTNTASLLLQLSSDDARTVLDRMSLPGSKILEKRGKTKAATYHLTKGIAKDLLGKAAYSKTKGINPIRYKEMVRQYVEDHGSISPAEVRTLLGFGESQSDRTQVSKLLREWSSNIGFLDKKGDGPSRRYFFRVASNINK